MRMWFYPIRPTLIFETSKVVVCNASFDLNLWLGSDQQFSLQYVVFDQCFRGPRDYHKKWGMLCCNFVLIKCIPRNF